MPPVDTAVLRESTSSGQGAGHVVLRVESLSKHYGALAAVDRLDLEVREGEVFGLLGPNGCGKSTTLNMVMGLIRPTGGHVTILEHRVDQQRAPALAAVGGLVEGTGLYPYLTGRQNLQILARLRRLPGARVDEVLHQVAMEEAGDRAFGDYSQGMRQRLGVAAALLHRPTIVMLDEPTSGLDPAGTRDMRALIPALAREGRAVLLTSHLLHEVEQTCDRVAIMQRGRVIASGDVNALLSSAGRIAITVPPSDRARALERLRRLAAVREAHEAGEGIAVDGEASGDDLNRALVEVGIYASEIRGVHRSLEAVFLELTGEVAEAPAGPEAAS
jgi:ABC-2 type transport system ATP-binding protein